MTRKKHGGNHIKQDIGGVIEWYFGVILVLIRGGIDDGANLTVTVGETRI